MFGGERVCSAGYRPFRRTTPPLRCRRGRQGGCRSDRVPGDGWGFLRLGHRSSVRLSGRLQNDGNAPLGPRVALIVGVCGDGAPAVGRDRTAYIGYRSRKRLSSLAHTFVALLSIPRDDALLELEQVRIVGV